LSFRTGVLHAFRPSHGTIERDARCAAMRLNIHAQLDYPFGDPADILLQV
jgi:hypothetical protein